MQSLLFRSCLSLSADAVSCFAVLQLIQQRRGLLCPQSGNCISFGTGPRLAHQVKVEGREDGEVTVVAAAVAGTSATPPCHSTADSLPLLARLSKDNWKWRKDGRRRPQQPRRSAGDPRSQGSACHTNKGFPGRLHAAGGRRRYIKPLCKPARYCQ